MCPVVGKLQANHINGRHFRPFLSMPRMSVINGTELGREAIQRRIRRALKFRNHPRPGAVRMA